MTTGRIAYHARNVTLVKCIIECTLCDGKTHISTHQLCNTCKDCQQLPLHDGQSEYYLLHVKVDPAREKEDFYISYKYDPIKALLRTAQPCVF